MELASILTKINVDETWKNSYKEYVPKFINEAITKASWQDWDEDVFYEYFEKSAQQCVSSLQQGYFSNSEKATIKENWNSIGPLLKQIAESQDVPLFDVYEQIRNEVLTHTDNYKEAAVNRLIAGLQPKLLTTIVSYKHLNELYNLLLVNGIALLPNYQYNNWFRSSNSILQLFKAANPETDFYDLITYPWQTLILLREKKEQVSYDLQKNKELLQLLQYKKQIILQGPPGTGKTKLAKELAEQLINPESGLNANSELTDDTIVQALRGVFKLKTVAGGAVYEIVQVDALSKNVVLKKATEKEDKTSFTKIKQFFKDKKWDNSFVANDDRRAAALAKYLYDHLNNKTVNGTSGELILVQFHPSYTYEDFVRGIVAETKGDKIEYKNVNKILGKLAAAAKQNLDDNRKDVLYVSKEIKAKEYFELFVDEISEQITEGVNFKLTNNVSLIDVEVDAFRYKGQQGWTELGNRMPFKEIVQAFLDGNTTRQDLKNNQNLSGLAKQHASYFVRVLNMFQDYISKNGLRFDQLQSEKVPLKNYVLIIDEINRANLSSVLGELIYALEYRGEYVESIYAIGEKNDLILPDNLFIIGTMNTADRSVGHIDYAIRRRFAFVDVLPERLNDNDEIYFNTDGYEKVAALFNDENVSREFDKKMCG